MLSGSREKKQTEENNDIILSSNTPKEKTNLKIHIWVASLRET